MTLRPTWRPTASRITPPPYQPEQFETFLTERLRLMAQKIKQYYWGL